MSADLAAEPALPHQSYGALFLRFLRFGSLAWGGPVAQIAMIKRELVEQERWMSIEHFQRVLAVYQVLPGPEAHELCVYFGMVARGRLGGFLAGLAFMLPGFLLMFGLSWWYFTSGSLSPALAPVFAALQAAVLALVVRAVHRIGKHALGGHLLLVLALASFAAGMLGVHFLVSLALAGAIHAFHGAGRRSWAWIAAGVWIAACVATRFESTALDPVAALESVVRTPRSYGDLFLAGLSGGLLSFGGAYTAIPLLQRDAAGAGGWMTNAQFLDGLALSGVLPAPLIIFATFVGYAGGGALGAVAVTCGIFLPAFAFTLLAHQPIERLSQNPRVRGFLDGVTAALVGLICVTVVTLAPAALGSVKALVVFTGALFLSYYVQHRLGVLLVMASAALVGVLWS